MPEAKMSLEEAATHLHRMASFFNSLSTLEEVINTARSVDNIQNLAAERMAAAEAARLKMSEAQAALAAFEIASAKKHKEVDAQMEAAESEFRRRVADLDAEFETRRINQQSEMKKMQDSFAAASAALAQELSGLTAKRDDMLSQVDKAEKALDALRKKVATLVG